MDVEEAKVSLKRKDPPAVAKSHDQSLASVNEPAAKKQKPNDPAQGRPSYAKVPTSVGDPSPRLFVTNLSFAATMKDVRDAFSPYGTITDLKLPKNAQGKSKGIAFVTFSTQAQATGALQGMQSHKLQGRPLTVTYSLPYGEDQRQKKQKKHKEAKLPQQPTANMTPAALREALGEALESLRHHLGAVKRRGRTTLKTFGFMCRQLIRLCNAAPSVVGTSTAEQRQEISSLFADVYDKLTQALAYMYAGFLTLKDTKVLLVPTVKDWKKALDRLVALPTAAPGLLSSTSEQSIQERANSFNQFLVTCRVLFENNATELPVSVPQALGITTDDNDGDGDGGAAAMDVETEASGPADATAVDTLASRVVNQRYETEMKKEKAPSTAQVRRSTLQLILTELRSIPGWTDCGVALQPYGSIPAGLSISTSDMDLGISFKGGVPTALKAQVGDETRFLARKVLQAAAEALKHKYQVVTLLRARVPLVTVDCSTGVKCDLTLHNEANAKRTHLIRKCVDADPRVAPLIMAVKRWSRSRGLSGSSKQGISSFGWSLLVIQALQQTTPPILPPLKAVLEGAAPIAAPGKNSQTAGSLLRHFLSFYAELDPATVCVSVREGHPVSQAERSAQGLEFKSAHTEFQVEDPYDPSDNCARSIDARQLTQLQGEFHRGSLLLSHRGRIPNLAIDDLENQLFRPVTTDKVVQALFW